MPNAPQLYLITPPVTDPVAFRPLLQMALASAPVVSLHLKVTADDERGVLRLQQALIPLAQERGVAVVIDPPVDWRAVARSGADGVHVDAFNRLPDALKELKPDRIVGAGGLRLRDDAMTAGESGADYVMFGEPRADGSLPSFEQVLERCQWWAALFEVPCVGYAPGPEAVQPLARTGAEFIALGPWVFDGDIAAMMTFATRALDAPA